MKDASPRDELQNLLDRSDGPGEEIILANEHPHAVGKLDLEQSPLPFRAVPLNQAIHGEVRVAVARQCLTVSCHTSAEDPDLIANGFHGYIFRSALDERNDNAVSVEGGQ